MNRSSLSMSSASLLSTWAIDSGRSSVQIDAGRIPMGARNGTDLEAATGLCLHFGCARHRCVRGICERQAGGKCIAGSDSCRATVTGCAGCPASPIGTRQFGPDFNSPASSPPLSLEEIAC